jgi:two-component system nitrate/nitrite response regulator NarL
MLEHRRVFALGHRSMSNGILIVDDNASIRNLLRMLVETSTPFKVCGEAENGSEAIKKTKEFQPDLVLVDLAMPGMTGTETALILRLQQPRPKIILFTLHAEGVNQELASAYGIDVVLSKSDNIATVVSHITRLLSPAPKAQHPTQRQIPDARKRAGN